METEKTFTSKKGKKTKEKEKSPAVTGRG